MAIPWVHCPWRVIPGAARFTRRCCSSGPRSSPVTPTGTRVQDETDEAYGRRSAASLEDAIQEHGAGNIAAFFAEPVVGATMGAVPGDRTLLPENP